MIVVDDRISYDVIIAGIASWYPGAVVSIRDSRPHGQILDPEMEDVYNWGIQAPVNAAGYLCERVDMTTFTGDILDRVKDRIESAELVIADLTGANPNVYLEVGYAWGRRRPTLLIVKKENELKFDVRGQRCLVYKNITDLAKKLEADLKNLSCLA